MLIRLKFLLHYVAIVIFYISAFYSPLLFRISSRGTKKANF